MEDTIHMSTCWLWTSGYQSRYDRYEWLLLVCKYVLDYLLSCTVHYPGNVYRDHSWQTKLISHLLPFECECVLILIQRLENLWNLWLIISIWLLLWERMIYNGNFFNMPLECSATTFGSECTFKCNPRTISYGSDDDRVTCGANGKWSRPRKFCVATCRKPQTVSHSKLYTTDLVKNECEDTETEQFLMGTRCR